MLSKEICDRYKIPFNMQKYDSIELYSTYSAIDWIYEKCPYSFRKLIFYAMHRNDKKPLSFGWQQHGNVLRLYVWKASEKAGGKPIECIAIIDNNKEWYSTEHDWEVEE